MKICAIICEYNPFHTGHLYQIIEAKKRYDKIICVMSGNFVQRAQPAIAEKSVRAEIALRCGADMVLEMPVIYATANGETFAYGAVKTLSKLTGINALVMGCEADNTELLRQIAEIQVEEGAEYKEILSERMSHGATYASAITDATAEIAKNKGFDDGEVRDVLTKPNNLLCVEYVKAIKRMELDVKPDFIKRVGSGYHDTVTKGAFASATALRELLVKNDYTGAQPFLTGEADILLNELKTHPTDYKLYSQIAVYTLRTCDEQALRTTFDCREGIEYRLLENARKFVDLERILSETKTKRYTLARLRRIVLQLVLGITKELMTAEDYVPARLLAIKEDFKPYLAENGSKMIIRGEDLNKLNTEHLKKYAEVEKRAAALYSIVTDNDADLFVPKKLYSI